MLILTNLDNRYFYVPLSISYLIFYKDIELIVNFVRSVTQVHTFILQNIRIQIDIYMNKDIPTVRV